MASEFIPKEELVRMAERAQAEVPTLSDAPKERANLRRWMFLASLDRDKLLEHIAALDEAFKLHG